MPHIIKSNGNRETYDEIKIRRGVERALEKRPVESDKVEDMMHRINQALLTSGVREMPSQQLGELIMDELRRLDQVAFVRFASVYRSFQDVDEFSAEISRLQDMPDDSHDDETPDTDEDGSK
jgi:transcriptional repressor NrdR